MDLPVELYGMFGGGLAEVLGLWRLRHTAPAELPHYLRSPFYWVMTILMVTSGGIVAFTYIKSGISLSPILAVNVGASAPLIIGSLTATAPKIQHES